MIPKMFRVEESHAKLLLGSPCCLVPHPFTLSSCFGDGNAVGADTKTNVQYSSFYAPLSRLYLRRITSVDNRIFS